MLSKRAAKRCACSVRILYFCASKASKTEYLRVARLLEVVNLLVDELPKLFDDGAQVDVAAEQLDYLHVCAVN